jgi:hypothetical protein
VSVVVKINKTLPELEEVAISGWILQSDVLRITGINPVTLRKLRAAGKIVSHTEIQNEVWISLESLRAAAQIK